MDAAQGKKQAARKIILSDELMIKYTICPVIIRDRKTPVPSNEITMYLYSTKLCRKIGDLIRSRYPYTQKQSAQYQKLLKSGAAFMQEVRAPSEKYILHAVFCLLKRNAGLALTHTKDTIKRQVSISLNENMLATYWLSRFAVISNKYWATADEQKDAQEQLVNMLICFGGLDLAEFLDENKVKACCDNLQSQFDRLVGNGSLEPAYRAIVRESAGLSPRKTSVDSAPRADAVTNTIKQYSNVLWCVIAEYLFEHNANNQSQVQAIYNARFRNKPSISRGIGSNLVPKVLSREVYGEIFRDLTQKDKVNSVDIAVLMILFMGLSAEEVCAIRCSDVLNIQNYSPCRSVQITKAYRLKEKTKHTYYLSYDLQNREQYRNVPVPSAILRLIFKSKIGESDAPLLCDEHKKPLQPHVVSAALKGLFKTESQSITVTTRAKPKTIKLNFDAKNCGHSIERLWDVFGLQDNEIRYLRGRKQIDTAGKYYIDFNNPHKQYSMCVQMSYAVSNVCAKMVMSAEDTAERILHIGESAEIEGFFDQQRHTRLNILQPMNITLESNHGISVEKRGGK